MTQAQSLPQSSRRHISFLVNPTAGQGRPQVSHSCWKQLQALEANAGTDQVSVHCCESLAALRQHAALAATDPDNVVVAVGGDGTVHAVANALINQPATLGVLPVGSGNDFASLLQAPPIGEHHPPTALLDYFLKQPIGLADVACVEIDTPAGRQQRYMINGLGIGIEAQVAKTVRRMTRLSGLARYFAGALQALITHRTSALTLAVDGDVVVNDQPTLLVNVGNGRRAGGGFLFHPEAKVDDGQLDLCWVPDIPRWQQAVILPTVLWGGHHRFRSVHQARARCVRVSANAPMGLHIDGEWISGQASEIRIALCAHRLRVVGLTGEALRRRD